jgi:hypothetical protein
MRQAIAQRLRRKYFQAMRERDFSLGIDSVVTLDVCVGAVGEVGSDDLHPAMPFLLRSLTSLKFDG